MKALHTERLDTRKSVGQKPHIGNFSTWLKSLYSLIANGNGTAYSYTSDGKLATRTWARGVSTTYTYTNTTGEMIGIDYSDSTPDVSFTYDRLGRQVTVGDAQGTRTFSYDPSNLGLTNETIVAGGVTSVIARTQDSYGRPDGLMFGEDYSISYGYSSDGRFEAVDSVVLGVTNNWQYSYLQNSRLIEKFVETGAGVTNSRSYEANRNLLTEIHNQAQGSTISKYEYSNDSLGRRTQRIDTTAGVTTNDFGYNTRSELTNAVMGAESFAWEFDNIGNRDTYTTNGTTFTYLANELNQYTNIANGTTNSPTYDLDGNTLTYKGWTLLWTGENRIQSASNGSTVVSFQYDYMGRRFRKIVEAISTNLLYYDGWNLIAENSGGETTHHIWGLDLSGSMQGAGGVGGLLGTYTDSSMYFACADGNGNVTDYTDETGTNVVARYVYGAYGEILDSSGDKVDDFNILFSSKYLDRETAVPGCPGMYAYGYRELWDGRFMSKDPMMEQGASLKMHGVFIPGLMDALRQEFRIEEMALYVFVGNAPTVAYDPNGLAACVCPAGSNTGKKPKSGYTATSNGCGAAGGAGVDDDPMASIPPFNLPCTFKPACDTHDICYGTCNMIRSGCDWQFGNDLQGICSACADTYFGTGSSFWKTYWKAQCNTTGTTYGGGVLVGGQGPYDAAQKKACEPCCCP